MTSTKFSPEDLAAIEEIKQLKAKYCYHVDHKEWEKWAAIFTPDARVDESAYPIARDVITGERVPVPNYSLEFLDQLSAGFDWPLVGRDAIRAFGEAAGSDERTRTIHHVYQCEVILTSSTTAQADWPMEDYVWWPEGSPVRHSHGLGYYRETYEKLEDDRWYIASIDLTRSFIEYR
ncbi:MAG: nuclear transport factor 2 family protein [Mycetocola sp.]